MKFFDKILGKIGWGGVIIIALFIIFAIRGFIQNRALRANSLYTKGIINGTSFGSKGSKYLDYTFMVGEKQFNGSVPISFCKDCINCCEAGDTVIVKYDSINPDNNDLVVRLPNGEHLVESPLN